MVYLELSQNNFAILDINGEALIQTQYFRIGVLNL